MSGDIGDHQEYLEQPILKRRTPDERELYYIKKITEQAKTIKEQAERIEGLVELCNEALSFRCEPVKNWARAKELLTPHTEGE